MGRDGVAGARCRGGEGAGSPGEDECLQPGDEPGQGDEDEGLEAGLGEVAQIRFHPAAQGGEGVFQRGGLR
jgi:hypothetical protein